MAQDDGEYTTMTCRARTVAPSMALSPGAAAADAGGGGVADERGHAYGARCTWTASRFLKSVGLGPFARVGDEGRGGG
jgi:hypothetical protein